MILKSGLYGLILMTALPLAAQQYALTLSSGLTATPASPGSMYDAGTRVCLTATLPAGTVARWSGDPIDLNGCIVMNGPKSVAVTADGYTPPTGLSFVPVQPCRVVDTRGANGPRGGPIVTAGSTRNFQIAGACQVSSNASAYVLNISVKPTTRLSYLTAWATGEPRADFANINSYDGRIKGNTSIVPAGPGGQVSVYVTDETHVIMDVYGYFVDPREAGWAFYPVASCRITDTRIAGPAFSAGESRDIDMWGHCGISGALGYSLTVTAVPPGRLGYLTVWPAGTTRPDVSLLNAMPGNATANATVLGSGRAGKIAVYATDATDVIIDVNGYFAAPTGTGLKLYMTNGCRVWDTRIPAGSPRLNPASATDVVYDRHIPSSLCAVPQEPVYLFNTTVVPPAARLGYLTLWSQGSSKPLVSTLNAWDGTVTSNMAIVPANNGRVSAYPRNPTHLILDLFGFFAQ